MSSMGRVREFMSRNVVFLVAIPGICLAQYGWFKLQDNEKFVRKDERKEFPAITIFKHIRAFVGLGEPPEK